MSTCRMKFLDYDARPAPKTMHSCVKCQKDLKPGAPYRVLYLVGEEQVQVLHPADEGSYRGPVSMYPIGMDCARALGMEWTVPPLPKGGSAK